MYLRVSLIAYITENREIFHKKYLQNVANISANEERD